MGFSWIHWIHFTVRIRSQLGIHVNEKNTPFCNLVAFYLFLYYGTTFSDLLSCSFIGLKCTSFPSQESQLQGRLRRLNVSPLQNWNIYLCVGLAILRGEYQEKNLSRTLTITNTICYCTGSNIIYPIPSPWEGLDQWTKMPNLV